MTHRNLAAAALFAGMALACSAQTQKGKSSVTHEPFGKVGNAPVEIYALTNANGMTARIMTYGGTVVSLTAPDRAGKFADVVLGMDDVQGYTHQSNFFGALIGRYGNRIGHGTFTLDGKKYTLPKNDGDNTLHGGPEGFDKRIWTARAIQGAEPGLELMYISKDGEEGFPGELHTTVVYTLTNHNELKIEYSAVTQKDTVLNLTNHSYFNLAGANTGGTILNHEVTLYADQFTPVDSGLIPTGELKNVAGTPFDFTKSTAIGKRIEDNDQQLKYGHGYDHNWVLRAHTGMAKAAEVHEPTTGRVMEVWTDQPGLQFYTGNFLDGKVKGKGGIAYPHRGAFCMETQHFPDSPNKPKFPSTELKPGQTYRTTTIYKFSAR
ncbi:MAG TPA: aldose epimerase family protein [Candidatus Limnocylindrales bacterium]|nr:aldose epimerase family protein [Candidatus Limnocylindrales bacterium]